MEIVRKYGKEVQSMEVWKKYGEVKNVLSY